jgi:pyruvate/2-oxoglutarate dehydrogenase complex dihydrolipoamide acyltransferase (E2) component
MVTLAVDVYGQPSSSDKAMAEALFREGRKLFLAGDTSTACDKLAESQRLDASLGTLLNLALCHDKQGKTASAWAELNEAASIAAEQGRPDRERFAKDHAARLEAHLSRLLLTVAEPVAGLRVVLDGAELSAATLGTPLPVDPGEHRLEASAPDRKPWSQVLTIAPDAGTATVEIPALASTQTEAAPPATAAAQPSPSRAQPARDGVPRLSPTPSQDARDEGAGIDGLFVAGLITTGVGLAGIAVGTAFGVRTLQTEKDADALCPNTDCATQEGLVLHADAKRDATISTIGFVVGGVAAAGGATMLAVSLTRDDAPQEQARLTLVARGPSLHLEGTF